MTDRRLMQLIDRAFDYRGYVTVSHRDGSKRVGFVYHRGPAHIDLFDEPASRRIRVELDEIVDLELTGEDAAAHAQTIWKRRKGSLEPFELSQSSLELRGSAAGGPSDTSREDRPVLFLVALPIELRGVADVLGARVRGTTVRGRLGESRAVALAIGVGGAAAEAIAVERPRLVISCGFAGALDPSLASGDLVLASSVHDEYGESIPVLPPLLHAARQALERAGGPRVVEGELLCTTRVIATADEKRALSRPGRRAIDLESWPAAHAARQAGTPWLAIRVVLDRLSTDLPAFTCEMHASYVGAAMRHALGGPRAMVELARLGLRARSASRSLARGLRHLGPALGEWARAELGR